MPLRLCPLHSFCTERPLLTLLHAFLWNDKVPATKQNIRTHHHHHMKRSHWCYHIFEMNIEEKEKKRATSKLEPLCRRKKKTISNRYLDERNTVDSLLTYKWSRKKGDREKYVIMERLVYLQRWLMWHVWLSRTYSFHRIPSWYACAANL